MPELYIIAGPNGAGKTTASTTILPEVLNCKEFINADYIAAGISPFNSDSVAVQAGRIMLERIQKMISEHQSFAIETTLSTKYYQNLIHQAKKEGYKTTIIFFWLKSPELAIQRVSKRVSLGGHNIPSNVIIRRYSRGISNLLKVFINLCDVWMLYDNSDLAPILIAKGADQSEIEIINETTFNLINRYVEE